MLDFNHRVLFTLDDRITIATKNFYSFFQDFMLLNQLSEGIGDAISCDNNTEEQNISKTTPRQSPRGKTAKTPKTTPLESPLNNTWDEDDPFGQDDSFLVQCSQAIDEDLTRQSAMSKSSSSSNSLDSNSNHTFKKPELTVKKLSSSKPSSTMTSSSSIVTSQASSNDVFDDDDSEEFEMLLSQIDIPKVPTPKKPIPFKTTTQSKQTILQKQTVPIVTASGVIQPSAVKGPPRPALAQPQPLKSVLAQPVKPVMAQPVKPVLAQPVKPVTAQPVRPVMAQPVKPIMVPPQPQKPILTQPQNANSRVNTNLVR